MVKVYSSDVPALGILDWEDMLDNPRSGVSSDWRNWNKLGKTVFEIDRREPIWSWAPFERFMFVPNMEGEPMDVENELELLVDDLSSMRGLKVSLSMEFFDSELADDMKGVQGKFWDAHDTAAARALAMIVRAAWEKRRSER